MGSAITTCDCLGGNDGEVIPSRDTTDSVSSTSSDSDSTFDEEREPLKNKQKSKGRKKKQQNKKSKSKSKRKAKRDDSRSQLRDESYFSESDNEQNVDSKRKKKKKSKKSKSKQKNKPNESKENEINPNNNNNMGVLYGMDTKTMELLLNVGDFGQNSSPQPSMPSIASEPATSVDFNDVQTNASIAASTDNRSSQQHPDHMKDRSLQLQNYDSNEMYKSAENEEDDQVYDALTVEDDDNHDHTPALPSNHNINNDGDGDKGGDNNSLSTQQKKTLGGLDYDFEHEAKLQAMNTLREDEKNVSIKRIHETIQKSQGHEEIETLIAKQYDHESDESEDSSMSEDEKAEIQRLKTEEMNKSGNGLNSNNKPSSKAKLFRPGTTTPWNEEDVNDTMSAMARELEAMQRRSSQEPQGQIKSDEEKVVNFIQTDDEPDDVSDDDGQIVMALKQGNDGGDVKKIGDKKQSQLFRHKSAFKWDTDDLEQQHKEMQEQFVHLMKRELDHQQSIENDPTKQAQMLPSNGSP